MPGERLGIPGDEEGAAVRVGAAPGLVIEPTVRNEAARERSAITSER